MHTFSSLLKKIRQEAGITQGQLAKALGVSTILISMIETGQKPASIKFVGQLASKLDTHPSTILPSVFADIPNNSKHLSRPERSLLALGLRLQSKLVERKAKNLLKYVHSH